HARVSHASRNRLFIDQALADLPPLPQPVCEVRHVSTLIGLVENGLGVAVVPRLALPPPPSTVVGVKLDKPAISRTIGIIRRAGRSLSPAGEALAKLLTQASRATAKTMRR
ncbi:MAG TPA: LysR substrate-binding domain-containing protein, partial [Ramlibacter sp.]|nr:LysR substrate-binding domain-containing protein [Ramlibacter sp.]